jgi:hypothetical protein
MQKFRRVLYVVYLIFHLGILASVLHLKHQFNLLTDEFTFVLYMAIAGIFLFFIDLIVDQVIDRNHSAKITALEAEKNETKAKMYDLQEKKKIEISPESSIKPKSEDNPPKNIQ